MRGRMRLIQLPYAVCTIVRLARSRWLRRCSSRCFEPRDQRRRVLISLNSGHLGFEEAFRGKMVEGHERGVWGVASKRPDKRLTVDLCPGTVDDEISFLLHFVY